ncbi:MAG: class I SAM-dependent methyltransferase [Bacilli bacterium]
MIPEGNMIGNVERFSGFENDYDKFRPAAPHMVIEILTKYFGGKPSVVVDLGCGTGLSSFIWRDSADRVVGVEPNADMIHKAQDKLRGLSDASHISFVQGYSNQLDMASGAADIMTCSQSFHWMEPASTLKEASRVLRKGGIFAVYDCDWPPTVHWDIEDQYIRLMDRVETIAATLTDKNDTVKKWNKKDHLKNMIESRAFRFTKEIVFHDWQSCDAERYVGLALSQGGLQTIHKADPTSLHEDIGAFRDNVKKYFRGETLDVIFSYRMRLGVK